MAMVHITQKSTLNQSIYLLVVGLASSRRRAVFDLCRQFVLQFLECLVLLRNDRLTSRLTNLDGGNKILVKQHDNSEKGTKKGVSVWDWAVNCSLSEEVRYSLHLYQFNRNCNSSNQFVQWARLQYWPAIFLWMRLSAHFVWPGPVLSRASKMLKHLSTVLFDFLKVKG